jgi:hypothetical protein
MLNAKVKNGGAYLHSPIHLHGMVFNLLSLGVTSPFRFLCAVMATFLHKSITYTEVLWLAFTLHCSSTYFTTVSK